MQICNGDSKLGFDSQTKQRIWNCLSGRRERGAVWCSVMGKDPLFKVVGLAIVSSKLKVVASRSSRP